MSRSSTDLTGTDGQVVGDPAKSRIGSMVEISDLTSDEVWRYLVQCRNIPAAKAKDVYDQVGGRVNQLQLVADGFQCGRELSGISPPLL